jgi:hypothetical protein
LASATTQTQQAISTTSVIDSLGVNTHLGTGGNYSNLSTIIADLNYLGLPNVRDSAGSASVLQTWQQVAQATGVKFDDYIGETSVAGMQSALAAIPQFAAAGILNAVEGGNEEDDSYPAGLGNSLGATAAVQSQLYAVAQSLGLPTINMSFGAGWTAANNWHGDYDKVGNLSSVTTYANAHTYPAGAPNVTIQQLNADAQLAANSSPVIMTEFGYDTNQYDMTTVAKYTLDAVFDGLKDGDVATYFYSLVDDSSGAFGLMNADGTPRPAGTALHNLTTLLADTGGSFTAGSLAYGLSGTLTGDNTLLMQKSDGSDWLAVWDEQNGAHSVTLNLANNASQISLYNPLTGTNVVQSASNTGTFTFTVNDTPLLVEISGANGTPATTPQAAAVTTTPAATTPAVTTPAPATPAVTTPAPTTPAATTPAVTTPAVTTPAVTTPAPTTYYTTAGGMQVVTLNDSTVNIGNTPSSVFLSGTGDTVTMGDGGNQVQGYAGGNNITTGNGNDTIALSGTGSTVNAGGGNNQISDAGANNTIVLPTAGTGTDTITGYVLNQGDTLDLRGLLAATQWNQDPSTIGTFVSVATVNNSAVISVSDNGTSPGVAVATLQGSGPVNLQTLLLHSQTS